MSRPSRSTVSVLLLLAVVAGVFAWALPAAAEFTIYEPGDGRVSPPFPLNSNPPRPVLTPPEAIPQFLNREAYLIVNTDNLNVRQGDAPEFAAVAVVDGGTALLPLGWNGDPDDAWWYVQVGGVRGWVRGTFVILRGNATSLPVIDPRGTIAIPRLYVGWDNFLRSEPFYNVPASCAFEGNLEHEIIGRTVDTQWYELRVVCDDGVIREGWLPADNGIFRNPGSVEVPVTWY
ncbi:MAG: hypothetical protein SF162_19420 [bacterium]|nr:hypothetical protein [bacterium]